MPVYPPILTNLVEPTSVSASGSWSSGILSLGGFPNVSVAVTSTQAGVISVQRFADNEGNIPLDYPATKNQASITANTPQAISIVDGAPAKSFQVVITNTGGSTATISHFAIVFGRKDIVGTLG